MNAQLLLLDAGTTAELRVRVARLAGRARGHRLDDLAAALRRELAGRPLRAAVVAESADQASERLAVLAAALPSTVDVDNGVFAGRAKDDPAIGYLFPGQGADIGTDSALARRFDVARPDSAATLPQQSIVDSSVAGLRVLSLLGIEASAAAGHSLGELTALHWADAVGRTELIPLVGAHSRILMNRAEKGGTMARIDTDAAQVEPLLHGEPVAVAGYNTPVQTIVAGPSDAVDRVRQTAVAAGFQADRIPVPAAFHTSAAAPAQAPMRDFLANADFHTLDRRVLSSVTGDFLPQEADLRDLLVRQLCEPVRFRQVLERLADEVDLIVEVGPDRLLSKLATRTCPGVPVVPMTTESTSLSGTLSAVATAYVLGTPVRHEVLATTAPPPVNRAAGN